MLQWGRCAGTTFYFLVFLKRQGFLKKLVLVTMGIANKHSSFQLKKQKFPVSAA